MERGGQGMRRKGQGKGAKGKGGVDESGRKVSKKAVLF